MSSLFRRVLYFNRRIGVTTAIVVTCILIQSCGKKDFSRLPSIGEDHLFMMVVEIPAGKNKKTEFNPITKEFETDQVNGSDRIIDFLAYPCNYGFIPSTMQNKAEGGDGDPLDVMLISESIPTGSVVKIIPLAVLHLTDNGETDDKIIAIPADPFARTINAIDYSSLSTRYPSIIQIIELWLQNYKGTGIIQPVKWGDEADATSTIIKSGTDKLK